MINYDAVRELCLHVDMLSYIEETYETPVIRSGSHFIHCPLGTHKDDNQSMIISAKKNTVYCFGCHKTMDMFDWLVKYEKKSFDDAILKLEKMSGRALTVENSKSLLFYKKMKKIQTKRLIDLSGRIYQDVNEYNKYSNELPELWIDEGISEEAMKYFNVRTDKKNNRIVYPIYDMDERYICAKARTTLTNPEIFDIPKYRYLGKIGTNNFLVGWKENHEEILNQNKIIIFEGIKSVMKAWGWGYKYTVSAETSSLNEEQVKIIIKNKIKDVTIAFDSDKKRKDIIGKLKTLKHFTNVYIVEDVKGLLDEKESPVDKGKDVFETLLEERMRI